jgi:hypothetical protein
LHRMRSSCGVLAENPIPLSIPERKSFARMGHIFSHADLKATKHPLKEYWNFKADSTHK